MEMPSWPGRDGGWPKRERGAAEAAGRGQRGGGPRHVRRRVSEGWTGSSPPGTGRGEEMAAGEVRFVDVGAGR